VEAARKAVELRPDLWFRPRLARCLAKAGNIEQAEKTYKKMLEKHPNRPKYWYFYAKFLFEYCPERLKKANQALEEARAPHKDWSVSPAKLSELRQKIEAKLKARNQIEATNIQN